MSTLLDRIEEQISELWQQRQNVLDVGQRQRELEAERAQLEAEVRAEHLPGDRQNEEEWQQAYEDWLRQGLDLFDDRASLNSSIRAHFGKPRTSVHVDLPRRVRAELERQQVLGRPPEDYDASMPKAQEQHLRDVIRTLERSNKQQAHDRARALRASLDRQRDV